ncbi:BREX-1 system adenine-specific DNA-methyltransferase PglX [Anaerovoracaceae bacterium Sow4_D4]
MNKTAIKNFATWARRDLIERVSNRALQYGITKDSVEDASAGTVGGTLLTAAEQKQRKALVSEIKSKGYDEVMEEVAYTWFNRFIAMRYMEVNNYLPSKVRVFSDEEGKFNPQILAEALHLDLPGLDMEKVYAFKEKNDNEGLYKYLIITQCNALNEILPGMFQKIDDYTELLLPDNLLRDGSVLEQMVSGIPEEDWQDAVQIIGWMYQYYNAELKDDTFAKLKKNVKITKERIPAATQLFTPDWIVRYMVENSLGRLWYEGHKTFDKSQWKYYLDEAEQEPEVEAQLAEIRKEYETIRPEDIKVIDPCMGSGHILVYAFDVLMQIYTSAGWSERDAAKSIVENNIYGLDIDDRAGQLSYFAIMMKARQYSRRIFSAGVNPMVYSIQDSSFMTQDLINYVANGDSEMAKSLNYIKSVFKDAKDLGSIINVKPVDFASIYMRMEVIRADNIENLFSMIYQQDVIDKLLPLIKQAEVMAQKYDVVVTNPPYMGASGMNAKLSEYVKTNYPDSKSDLFAVFIERCGKMIAHNRYQAMITQHAWMFLSSFEKLRNNIFEKNIVNMAHLGARAFEDISGEVVQTTAFIITNIKLIGYNSSFKMLVDAMSPAEKERLFLNEGVLHISKKEEYYSIPGRPVAYWLSKEMLDSFKGNCSIYDYSISPSQNVTGDNNKYLRLFWEVDNRFVGNPDKWIFYAKGGGFRKWYGNLVDVVDWTPTAREHYSSGNACQIIKEEYWYKKAITWCLICTGTPSFRVLPPGGTFDKGGSAIIVDKEKYNYLLALLNSKLCYEILKIYNPTIHYQVRDIRNIPLIFGNNDENKIVEIIAEKCTDISKEDWDSFETSWDFKAHPLV